MDYKEKANLSYLWGYQPIENLIEKFKDCIELNKEYKNAYNVTKDKLYQYPKGKQFDFDEDGNIFAKFDQFVKKLFKLIELFNIKKQIRILEHYNIEEMTSLVKEFDDIIKNFQAKVTALNQGKFDQDYVEFIVQITSKEENVKEYINKCFDNVQSIEQNLLLYKKFEKIFERDSIKKDLTEKYSAIFQAYHHELNNVEDKFGKSQTNPPLMRNMPKSAGSVLWARHLLQRIYEPMLTLGERSDPTKEVKPIFQKFNELGYRLTHYQILKVYEWFSTIDNIKLSLQSPLLYKEKDTD